LTHANEITARPRKTAHNQKPLQSIYHSLHNVGATTSLCYAPHNQTQLAAGVRARVVQALVSRLEGTQKWHHTQAGWAQADGSGNSAFVPNTVSSFSCIHHCTACQHDADKWSVACRAMRVVE